MSKTEMTSQNLEATHAYGLSLSLLPTVDNLLPFFFTVDDPRRHYVNAMPINIFFAVLLPHVDNSILFIDAGFRFFGLFGNDPFPIVEIQNVKILPFANIFRSKVHKYQEVVFSKDA